jgi:hypothetical protein
METGTGTGTGTGLTAAARVLWDAMVQKGLPVCYQSGPVLSSALNFMFTLGDNPREIGGDRDKDRGQKSEAGKEGEVTRSLGATEWYQSPSPSPLQDVDMNTNHPSLGIQVFNCRRLDLPSTIHALQEHSVLSCPALLFSVSICSTMPL